MYMSIFKLKGSFPLLLVMWFLCIEKLNNYSAFLTLKTIVDRYSKPCSSVLDGSMFSVFRFSLTACSSFFCPWRSQTVPIT